MIKLDDWQRNILSAKGNILLCTGRQVGKTTIFSIKAAKRMLEKKTRVLVVSLTEDQAQLIIVMMLNYIEQHSARMICQQGRKMPTKSRIILRNGSQVVSRAVGNTGNSIRGFTGDILIVDEASRMPEDVWVAAKPTLLTTAGEIWMCSTPFGRQGYFYECYCNPKRYKVFHISSEEVIKNRPISASWTKEQREAAILFLEQEERDMGKVRYAQEYLGKFMEDLRQFFPDDLIKKCQVVKRPENIRKKHRYFLGVDIARMGEDESTFEILVLREDRKLVQVESQITTKTLLSETTRHIISLDRTYNFEKIYLDDEGIGVGVFDHLLEEEQVRRKVIPINNSKRVLDHDETRTKKLLKEDLYNNLLVLMERGEIMLLDDPEIFQSLKSVQYEYTKDTFGRPHLKIFGNYTHIVEGLIRAAWCRKGKNLNIWVRSIKV